VYELREFDAQRRSLAGELIGSSRLSERLGRPTHLLRLRVAIGALRAWTSASCRAVRDTAGPAHLVRLRAASGALRA